MFILENLMNKLELVSSRAICIYQQVLRMSDDLNSLEGRDFVEKRRIRAVPIVSKLKDLFTVYWEHLDDKQKEYVCIFSERFDVNKTSVVTALYGDYKFIFSDILYNSRTILVLSAVIRK